MSNLVHLGVFCALLAACGADSQPAPNGGDGADSQVEQSPDASAVQTGSADGGDAAVTASDAGDGSDGSALDADTLASDAQSPAEDAAARCALTPAAPVCESRLCTASGSTWLTVHADEPWQVGGLDWLLAICERPGREWPRTRSADGLDLGFRLRAADLTELKAGAAVPLYWGSPGDAPGLNKRCSFQTSSPLPECPFEGPCTTERKAQITALAPRPECLPCADAGIDPCFAPGSCGCWCANRDALRDACPGLIP